MAKIFFNFLILEGVGNINSFLRQFVFFSAEVASLRFFTILLGDQTWGKFRIFDCGKMLSFLASG